MNVQSAIDMIAAKAGLQPALAERAAGTILSVIQQEVDPTLAAKIFASLPGAADLAAANAVNPSSGGFLGSIASSILGSKAGVLAAGFSQLEASGLTIAQIETSAAALLAWVKSAAGPGLAGQIANAIPGLAKKS